MRPVYIGFTGSRKGMTVEQELAVDEILRHCVKKYEGRVVVLHGDCVGADEKFHELALKREVLVHIYPPTNPKHRAFCKGAVCVHPEAPYLQRNYNIVDRATLMVACPGEDREVPRSGTWATVRYADGEGRQVIQLLPDAMPLKRMKLHLLFFDWRVCNRLHVAEAAK